MIYQTPKKSTSPCIFRDDNLTLSDPDCRKGAAQLFSNAASTHRTLPTLLINLQLGQGSHTVQMTASGSNVTSDYNDLFAATILY
jgi:hypothetical protein